MRILIYSETENAKRQLMEVRQDGHHASLRNPQHFRANEIEQCDQVLAASAEIIEAYRAKGIEADFLIEAVSVQVESETCFTAEEVKPQPAKRRRRK
jgi:hypothetical protein